MSRFMAPSRISEGTISPYTIRRIDMQEIAGVLTLRSNNSSSRLRRFTCTRRRCDASKWRRGVLFFALLLQMSAPWQSVSVFFFSCVLTCVFALTAVKGAMSDPSFGRTEPVSSSAVCTVSDLLMLPDRCRLFTQGSMFFPIPNVHGQTRRHTTHINDKANGNRK